MGAPAVGDIVLVPFPYSDLSARKLRPAFVAAQADKGDLILCQITSRSYASTWAVPIPAEPSGLGRDSFLRPDKLFTADAHLIVRRLGALGPRDTARARAEIARLFD